MTAPSSKPSTPLPPTPLKELYVVLPPLKDVPVFELEEISFFGARSLIDFV